MKFLLLFFAVLSQFFLGQNPFHESKPTNKPVADSLPPPVISFQPPEIHITDSTGAFISREISVLNRGGKPLDIRNVHASCYCATAAVLDRSVYPFGIGKIRLSINPKSISDTLSSVQFTVESNAQNSPSTISVIVHKIFKHSLNDTIR